jgi:hypothetical protein
MSGEIQLSFQIPFGSKSLILNVRESTLTKEVLKLSLQIFCFDIAPLFMTQKSMSPLIIMLLCKSLIHIFVVDVLFFLSVGDSI